MFKPGCFGGSETEWSDQQQKCNDSLAINLPEATPQTLQAGHQDLSEGLRDNRFQDFPSFAQIICYGVFNLVRLGTPGGIVCGD